MSKIVMPAASVMRGDTAESVHNASIAVVGREGKLTHYFGDPKMMVMTRSSIKPFQLMPLIASGGADHFQFSPKQLSVMCGSHVGSDEHRSVVTSNLKAANNDTDDLQCGSHWPLGMRLENRYPLNGEDKDSLRHNCSGKHSGFLAQARFLGEERADYLNPESKVQKLVRENLAIFCEFPEEKMGRGTDGCSAPNFSMPLINLALGFKKLASADGDGEQMKKVVERVREAMWQHPEMVSGEKRFDLDLMRSFPNNVVCKIGAESLQGIGFANPPVGIAVKVHDGNSRALGAICVELLRQLGIIDEIGQFSHLVRHTRPEIRNYRKILTGKILVDFKLKKV